MNNSNLRPYLVRFRDIMDYWSNFRGRKGASVKAMVLLQVLDSDSVLQIWYPETRNVPLSCGAKHILMSWTVKACLTIVTDGRTDGQTYRLWHNKCHTSLGCAAKNIYGPRRSIVATPMILMKASWANLDALAHTVWQITRCSVAPRTCKLSVLRALRMTV